MTWLPDGGESNAARSDKHHCWPRSEYVGFRRLSPHPMLDLAAVRSARQRIAGRVHTTPTLSATRLGDRVGVRLVLKCENLQKTGSFKARGALNKLSQLTDAERANGVVTVSAGNHAQALAWAARAAGVHATVVMYAAASPAKVEASRGYGAEVVLYGTTGNDAFAKAGLSGVACLLLLFVALFAPLFDQHETHGHKNKIEDQQLGALPVSCTHVALHDRIGEGEQAGKNYDRRNLSQAMLDRKNCAEHQQWN
jgi:hypothetical protein